MAARNMSVFSEPQPHQDIAAETLDQRDPLAGLRTHRCANQTVRKSSKNLTDQRQALLNFTEADPDAGIDIALLEKWDFEGQAVIGRISECAARVKVPPGSAADIPAGTELLRQARA